MPKEVLYAGLDESNHHNGNQHPEVCVAVFSAIKEDRECCVFNSSKDYVWKNEMLKDARRDYRFLLLNCNDIYPRRHNNLPVVAKSLVMPFLELESCKHERLETSKMLFVYPTCFNSQKIKAFLIASETEVSDSFKNF